MLISFELRCDYRFSRVVGKRDKFYCLDQIPLSQLLQIPDNLALPFPAVTGSRMNCNVTTVEGLPSSTGLNSS